MAYPEPSDWNSNNERAAYFFEGNRLLQTEGFSFLNDLFSEIRQMQASIPMTDWSGQRLAPLPLFGDVLSWDAETLRILDAAARALRVEDRYAQSIQNDARSSSISVDTLRTAIWVAYLNQRQRMVDGRDAGIQYGIGSPASAEIPQSTILPRFGVRLPAMRFWRTGLSVDVVDPSARPPMVPDRVQTGTGNFWIAAGFFAVIAVGAAISMINVPKGTRSVANKRKRR